MAEIACPRRRRALASKWIRTRCAASNWAPLIRSDIPANHSDAFLTKMIHSVKACRARLALPDARPAIGRRNWRQRARTMTVDEASVQFLNWLDRRVLDAG